MSKFYSKVISADPVDLESVIITAYDWFDEQYEDGRKDLIVKGRKIEDVAKTIPGIVEFRYGQLQEIEAILSFLERREDEMRGIKRKHYTEHYARTLNATQVERYSDSDPDVLQFRALRELMSLVRNRFLGLTKGYEYMHYQIRNIVELRKAQIEDSTL